MSLIEKEVMDDLPKVSGSVATPQKRLYSNDNDALYIPSTANGAAITYTSIAPSAAEQQSADSKKIGQIFNMNIVILLVVIVSLIVHLFSMFVFKGGAASRSSDQQTLY